MILRTCNQLEKSIWYICEAHPASCTMGTGSFLGVNSGRGVTLNPHPLPVPWAWKGRAIPLLPYGPYGLYRTSVPVQGWPLPLPYLNLCNNDAFHKTQPLHNDTHIICSTSPVKRFNKHKHWNILCIIWRFVRVPNLKFNCPPPLPVVILENIQVFNIRVTQFVL